MSSKTLRFSRLGDIEFFKRGKDVTIKLKEISLSLYKKASSYTESKGIIIADTKF